MKTRALKAKCLLVSKSVKDEESFVRQTRKPSAEFCHYFEQQPEGKAMLKSKFCHEFKEMKENNFTIVQLMIAEAVHVDV